MEQIGNLPPRRPAQATMFDFDGTVALVRSGWMPAMLDMMMRTLAPLGPDPAALRAEAEAYVARLAGKDTIHQMSAFADHVRSLGGQPLTAAQYKADFFAFLAPIQAERLKAVTEGRKPAASLLVPGVVELFQALRARGIRIYLASGTAHDDIVLESELLGIARFFDGIYGAGPGRLSKRELLEWIVRSGVERDRIVTFGDGCVEIEAASEAGGIAVGLATNEEDGCLTVDSKKRNWLIGAGAHYIIPNYLDARVIKIVTGES